MKIDRERERWRRRIRDMKIDTERERDGEEGKGT